MSESVAIIGGGGAGLLSGQALLRRGIEPTIFEAREGIGGNWRYDPAPGRSSCYASLITNTSRWRTTPRALRIRPWGSTHMGHREMLEYLERFARHFDLNSRIRTATEVAAARPVGGGWEVETEGGERSHHSAVVVATGYNSVPLIPDWPGEFEGEITHTHDYRTPDPYRGKDVVVVGMGCSATELACEIAHHARSVTLLARSSRDIVPHKIGLLPSDIMDSTASSFLPWSLRRRLVGATSRLTVGDLTRYGLPAPPARTGDAPIAVSGELRSSLRAGRVQGRTGSIKRLAGDRVILEDGTELAADAVLAGTGYRTDFPFLPAEFEAPTLEGARLYRGIASPEAPGLFFVGMVAGHGGLLPMFEAQANWVASVLSGSLLLPSKEGMEESIAADAVIRKRDFDGRMAILFDRVRYTRKVSAEARRGGMSPAGRPTLA